MEQRSQSRSTFFLVTAVVLAVSALVVVGCSSNSLSTGSSTITANTTSVPVSITDAPSDQVLAATLTLNSVVLTNSAGKSTSNLLSSSLTFEATHLDAVQEPLFTPAIPEDTYASVTLGYANAVVAYIDPTSKQVVTASVTPTTSQQTITFPSAVTVGNTRTALLIDFLVAQSVNISGSTVTVTPNFHVSAAPVNPQPTNGANGLLCGVKGLVSGVNATNNQFTISNPAGVSMTVTVNSNTQYQGNGLTGIAQLKAGMFVEVDVELQTDGTLLATRVEEEQAPNTAGVMLVGPVTAVSGSPATSFTQVSREQVGQASPSAVATNTIIIAGTTQFLLPGRLQNLATGGIPFTPTFSASTLFKGQVVAVATNGVTNNAATAIGVMLAPQTVGGTVASQSTSSGWTQIVLTLPTDSWLATLTGKASVTVLVPAGVQMVSPTAAGVGGQARFNGFLFNNGGTLTLVAVVEGPAPGTAISQH
jgi:hypothetical protein